MQKIINLKFQADSMNDDNNIGKFTAIASQSGIMTSHQIVFADNAFADAIKSLKSNKKNLPMLFNHSEDEIIGGFPTSNIKEKDGSLTMLGEINLDVQRGKEVFSLIKQEVITDLSVAVRVDDPEEDLEFNEELDALVIKRVGDLFETSIVFKGANTKAKIVEFGTVSFQDLPIADNDVAWDKSKALDRVRDFTKSYDGPSSSYKSSFFWFDSDNSDNFGAYKLLFTDIIDGKLKAIPRAISSVVGVLNDTSGGVDIRASDKSAIKRNINRYLSKMGKDKAFSDIKQIDEFSLRDCEIFLTNETTLSKAQSKQFISAIKQSRRDDSGSQKVEQENVERDVLDMLTHSNLLLKLRDMNYA